MNEDLRDLYQEIILEHSKHPRNKRKMDDSTRSVEGFNPLCGDQVTMYLKIEDGIVKDASFDGSGCAISVASASMLTESLIGKTEEEALTLYNQFHDMLTERQEQPGDFCEGLGKLAAFSGVREFPMRVKCASLCWHATRQALGDSDGDEHAEHKHE